MALLFILLTAVEELLLVPLVLDNDNDHQIKNKANERSDWQGKY